ncbi:MAG: hypothetical protein ACRD2G_13825 [Terriglobia bacterium]
MGSTRRYLLRDAMRRGGTPKNLPPLSISSQSNVVLVAEEKLNDGDTEKI